MTSAFDAKEFNDMFGEALGRGGEHLTKVAEVTGLYIQEKLRENSFARQILPPQTVTVAELTRNETSEDLVYIDDLEPDSIAMRINMRGEPDKTYIQGKRYSIRIETITSDRFQKTEQELRSYRMPLTKIIEQNTVKDLQEQVDTKFMEHVRAGLMIATTVRMNKLVEAGMVVNNVGPTGIEDAVADDAGRNFYNSAALYSYLYTRNISGITEGGALADAGTNPAIVSGFGTAHASYNPADGFYSNIIMSEETTFNRRVVAQAVKICTANQMKAKVLLLHEYDWNDTIAWTDQDAGLDLIKEIVVGGYKYTTIGGFTYVTTLRDNPAILQPGQIYVFPAPEMLGRFLVLQNTQFYINKEGRFFNMEAWEECGVGFGNIKGLGLVLLAGASAIMPNYFLDSANDYSDAENSITGTFTLTNDADALG